MHRRIGCLLLAAACIGCGDDNPFDYIPVSGRLSYDDGTPIPASGIRLGFSVQGVEPRDGKYPLPGEALVDAQGNFSQVTTYRPGDGLIPGMHRVSIHYATDGKGKLLIPKDYSHPSTSPLVVDTANLPLEIKVPRP